MSIATDALDPMTEPDEDLVRLAALLRERAAIELEISQLVGRPALPGHIGEFIASRVFGIGLHESAPARASDGVFDAEPVLGRTVNVKLYGRQEGLLDLPLDGVGACDFTLVLSGPRRGRARIAGRHTAGHVTWRTCSRTPLSWLTCGCVA